MEPATKPTIAASYPKAFLEFAVARGADRQALLARSGIRADDLAHTEDRVWLERYVALIEAAVELTGEPTLALKFGEAVKVEEVSIVALIGGASQTVGECFEQINRYARLTIDGPARAAAPMQLVRDAEGLWLTVTDTTFVSHRYLEEISLAQGMSGSLRLFQGSVAAAPVVHCLHEAPSYRSEYERILGAPIVFASKRHAVRVPEEFLSIKIPTSNRYVFGILSERAQALLQALEQSKSVRGEVERLLAIGLHRGDAGIDDIAGKLGVSRKTLYRQLKAEGATFERVLDELRCRLALSFLSDNKVSVGETAYLTGFSEPAAFSRAFKRWTGITPGAARAAKARL